MVWGAVGGALSLFMTFGALLLSTMGFVLHVTEVRRIRQANRLASQMSMAAAAAAVAAADAVRNNNCPDDEEAGAVEKKP